MSEYKRENKCLQMENELLQDFLRSTERKWKQRQNMLWSIVIGKSIQFVGCVNLWSFLEWVLRLHPQSEPSEPKPGNYRSDHPTAEAMQKHIRLSPDADLAGQKWLSQESYESKRFAVWNSSPQTLAADGTRPVFDWRSLFCTIHTLLGSLSSR